MIPNFLEPLTSINMVERPQRVDLDFNMRPEPIVSGSIDNELNEKFDFQIDVEIILE